MRTGLVPRRTVAALVLVPLVLLGALSLPALAGEPDLELTVSPASATVPWGGTQPLTVTVTNNGDGTSGYATLDDSTAGTEFSCGDQSFPVFRALGPGESASLECAAGPVTTDSSVALSITALGTQLAPSVTVPLVVEGGPPLELQVTPASLDLQTGENAVFDVTLTNSSVAAVDDVVVASRVPSCSREIGTLTNGASGQVTWQCTAVWGTDFSGPFTQYFQATGTSRLAVVGDVDGHADVEVSVAGEAPSFADAEVSIAPTSQDVGYGAEAEVTMAITNTGDVPLSQITANTLSANDQVTGYIPCSLFVPFDFVLRPGDTVTKTCSDAPTSDIEFFAQMSARAASGGGQCDESSSFSFTCNPGPGDSQQIFRASDPASVTVGAQAPDLRVVPLPQLVSLGDTTSASPPVGEPQELAVFVQNLTGAALPEVVVEAPGVADCSRSLGGIGTGDTAVVGFVCTVTAEEIGAEYDQSVDFAGFVLRSTFVARGSRRAGRCTRQRNRIDQPGHGTRCRALVGIHRGAVRLQRSHRRDGHQPDLAAGDRAPALDQPVLGHGHGLRPGARRSGSRRIDPARLHLRAPDAAELPRQPRMAGWAFLGNG
ncbi:MAG: hypothetical protein R2716_08160 [Microthrixaceae bacterium]